MIYQTGIHKNRFLNIPFGMAILTVVILFKATIAESVEYRVVTVNRTNRPLTNHPVEVYLPSVELENAGKVEVIDSGNAIPSQYITGMTGGLCELKKSGIVFQADFGPGEFKTFILNVSGKPAPLDKTAEFTANQKTLTNNLVEVILNSHGAFFSGLYLNSENKKLRFFGPVNGLHSFGRQLPGLKLKGALGVTAEGPVYWCIETSGFNPEYKVGWHKRVRLWHDSHNVQCDLILKNCSEKAYRFSQLCFLSFRPEPGGRLSNNIKEYGKDIVQYPYAGEIRTVEIGPGIPRGNWLKSAAKQYLFKDTNCLQSNRSVFMSIHSTFPLQTMLYNFGVKQKKARDMIIWALIYPGEARDFPTFSPGQEVSCSLWICPDPDKNVLTREKVFPQKSDIDVFILKK